VNRKAIVLTRLAALVLLIGIAAAGCATSGASASGSTSPTSTAPSSQSASAIPTPIDSAAPSATDSAAPSATVMTGPTSTAEATNAPAPTAAGPASVDLGTAGNYVLLSKAGISTTGTTKIIGDIGVSPIAASAITGFGLVLDKSRTFSTSTLVTGESTQPTMRPQRRAYSRRR